MERWERIPVENFEKQLIEITTDRDLITFGKYAGKTYRWVFTKDPAYCEWIIQTVDHDRETSCTQMKRLGSYLVGKHAQMGGFPEVPAGVLDKEL